MIVPVAAGLVLAPARVAVSWTEPPMRIDDADSAVVKVGLHITTKLSVVSNVGCIPPTSALVVPAHEAE